MNFGIQSYASSYLPASRTERSSTTVELPDARRAGLAGPNGQGASVEVSISPQAMTMMTIDMDSLAAKGYTRVDIDTDGKPGAEISIEVKPGAGRVAVSTMAGSIPVGSPDLMERLRLLAQGEPTLFDMLLKELQASAEDEQSKRPTEQSEEARRLARQGMLTPDKPLVNIALRAYNDASSR